MSGTFNFSPNSLVPEEIPPQPPKGVSLNGWHFSAKPNVPYQASWKVTLEGMYWYLGESGLFDTTTDPTHNARLLEIFYKQHQTWDPFTWYHPHIGNLTVNFSETVLIPKALPNSGGLIEPFEITLIHNDPGY